MVVGLIRYLKVDWADDFLADRLTAHSVTSVAVVILPNRGSAEESKTPAKDEDRVATLTWSTTPDVWFSQAFSANFFFCIAWLMACARRINKLRFV